MNKPLKKLLCTAVSLSMIAGSVTIPLTASADFTGTIAIEGDKAIVRSSEDSAVALVASYNGGNLADLKKTDVTKDTDVTINVKPGDKVMLWSSLDKMVPIAEAKEVPGEPVSETTAKPGTPDATVEPGEPETTAEPKPAVTEEPDLPEATFEPIEQLNPEKTWKYDFGSAENKAGDDYMVVSADTSYSASTGYGLLGLENGFALDSREDGWVMTQGFDLKLENGGKETVETADDDWVATTTREEGNQPYNSPVRFSMKVDGNTYYRVRIHLVRADAAKEAKASLFTEKRHQHFLDKPIPEEGLSYETNVYVHNNWSKNTGNYSDTQLSIAASGDNVAVSSIEVYKLAQGKTFWILGDSTVCQQTAPIPYWPLDHCQGVGSAMTKYISRDWALVNEAESGLSAQSSTSHFNNMKDDIKEGDVVWFEFGHNDDKVTNDPSTNGYLNTLESFYNTITAAKANLIIAAPIQRCTSGQYDGTKDEGKRWSASLAQYGKAASNYVEEKIAAGATNIAYIDLNAGSLDFLNKVQTDIDKIRADAGLASLGAVTPRFYYYVSKYAGYIQDYTHPNDFGADNFAKVAINDAKAQIAAAETEDATNSQKVQANVFKLIFDDTRGGKAVAVSDDVVKAGAAANSFYPSQLAKVILYDHPYIVTAVSFNDDNTPAKMTVKLVASEEEASYGRAIIDIYDSEGNLKGTVKATNDAIDSVSSEIQEISFDSSTITFDAAAGDTFKAYVHAIDGDTLQEEDRIVSTTYTQNDMIDVKEYLLQGRIGNENKEDFSTYDLTEGQRISTSSNGGDAVTGWIIPGGGVVAFDYAKEDDITYAHCEASSNSYYPEKTFSSAGISSGKLYTRLDVRYVSGECNLFFTGGSQLNSFNGYLNPVQIKTDGSEVKVFLQGNAVASINAGEWVTLALTVDLDYGTCALSLNGKTYEAAFAPFNSSDALINPSKLALIAFRSGAGTSEFDFTNLVVATLNSDAVPDKTLTVATDDASMGSVSIKNGENAVEGTSLSVPMNTIVTAVAEPKTGYQLKNWVDAEGNVVGYAPEYPVRLHDDISVKAVFEEEEYDPITYLYKENFSTFTTSNIDWSKNATVTVEHDSGNEEEIGNYFRAYANANGNRTSYKAFDSAAQVAGDIMLEFYMQMSPGTNRANQLTIVGKTVDEKGNDSVSETKNGFITNNYVFSFTQGNNSNEFDINATTIGDNEVSGSEGKSSGYVKGTWAKVSARLNFTTKKVALKVTSLDGKSTYVDGTYDMAENVTALGAIQATCSRSGGIVCLDNIKVYTADQLESTGD